MEMGWLDVAIVIRRLDRGQIVLRDEMHSHYWLTRFLSVWILQSLGVGSIFLNNSSMYLETSWKILVSLERTYIHPGSSKNSIFSPFFFSFDSVVLGIAWKVDFFVATLGCMLAFETRVEILFFNVFLMCHKRWKHPLDLRTRERERESKGKIFKEIEIVSVIGTESHSSLQNKNGLISNETKHRKPRV